MRGSCAPGEYGSLEATQAALDENRIDYAVSLPVMPNSSLRKRLQPQAGAAAPSVHQRGFSPAHPRMTANAAGHCPGAKGLKLHPILQNVPLTDERTYAAVEVFGELGLPVTSHCGINDYYKPGSKYQPLAPKEYGELHYMLALIERYPDYILVPATRATAAGSRGAGAGGEAARLEKRVYRHLLQKRGRDAGAGRAVRRTSCCSPPITLLTGSPSLWRPARRPLQTTPFWRTRCFTGMRQGCCICERRQRRKKMDFTLMQDAKILYGEGRTGEVGALLRQLGVQKALVVCDEGVKRAGIAGQVTASLQNGRVEFAVFDRVQADPPSALVDEGAAFGAGGYSAVVAGGRQEQHRHGQGHQPAALQRGGHYGICRPGPAHEPGGESGGDPHDLGHRSELSDGLVITSPGM